MRCARALTLLLIPFATGGCACLADGGLGFSPGPITREYAGADRLSSVPAGMRVGERAAAPDVAAYGAGERSAIVSAYQADARDPDTAFCLACIVAGGGHLYSGERTKGAVLLGVAASGLIGGVLLSDDGETEYNPGGDGCVYDPETNECRSSDANRTPLWIGAGIAAGSWIYGIIDSRASATRMNARTGLQIGGATVEPRPWLGLRRDGFGAGFQLNVTPRD
jgi:hypothetical protein